jgi:hypothetical protein
MVIPVGDLKTKIIMIEIPRAEAPAQEQRFVDMAWTEIAATHSDIVDKCALRLRNLRADPRPVPAPGPPQEFLR